MALNVITVNKVCTLTVAGVQHTYAVNDTVNPGDPFYYPLLWGSYAVDSGNPPAGQVVYNDSVRNVHVSDTELPYLGTDDVLIDKTNSVVKFKKADGTYSVLSVLPTDVKANSSISFASKPDGAVPATTDYGEAISAVGQHGSLAVSGGKVVATPDASGIPLFLYNNISHAADLVGAFSSFTFPAQGGGTLTGAQGIHAFSIPYNGVGVGGRARIHWGVGPGGTYAFRIVGSTGAGTALSNSITGNFTPPPLDGVTPWKCGWMVDPDTGDVYLRLPDYSVARITAAAIAASASAVGIVANDRDVRNIPSPVSVFEWFQNFTTDILPSESSREVFYDKSAASFITRLRELKIASANGVGAQPGLRVFEIDFGVPFSIGTGGWNLSYVTTTWENKNFATTSPAIGDSAQWLFDGSVGPWAMTILAAKFSSYGQWKFEVSSDLGVTWTTISASVDLYNASSLPSKIGIGFNLFKTGTHIMKATCIGKNASSSSYSCSLTKAVGLRTS